MTLRLQQLLSTRWFSALAFLLAAFAKIAMQVYFLNIGGDRSFQLVATRNFLAGHGLTINQAFITDLAQQHYVPLVGWPPGYSFLLAPFYSLLPDQPALATIIVDALTILLFLWFSRRILVQLALPVWLVNIFVLLSGFFIYDFCTASSSDFIALAFYLWTVSLTLQFLQNENTAPRFAIVMALVGFICPLVRYMYLPIAFVIPAYLLLTGKINRNRRWWRAGLLHVAVTLLLCLGLLLFQQFYTGAATYMIPSEKGFFPANIARMDPFVFASVFNLAFFCSIGEKLTGIGYVQLVEWLRWLNFIPALFLAGWLLKYVWKQKGRNHSLTDHYLHIGGISSIATIGLLAMLSLRNAGIRTATYPFWTFIEEPRYFAFILIFLQQLFFVYAWQNRERIKSGWRKWVVVLVAVLLMAEFLHGVYYTTKIVAKEHTNFYADKTDHALVSYTQQLAVQLQKDHPDKVIVFGSWDPSFCNLASLGGVSGLYQAPELNKRNWRSSRPYILIMVIRKEEEAAFSPFLSTPGIEKIHTIGSHDFYRLEQ
jgi:hypothetical protein